MTRKHHRPNQTAATLEKRMTCFEPGTGESARGQNAFLEEI